MPTKQEIEARDTRRSLLQRQVPGLTCWIVYEPKHPDTDLWLNCLVAAYNANPTEIVQAGQGGRHRIVAERMYDRIKAEEKSRG